MSEDNKTVLNQDHPLEHSAQDDQIAELKSKIGELTNNWKRTAADFENYKRRKDQEAPTLIQFGKESTILELIPSLQSLEQALKLAPNDDKYKDWLAGLRATILQLEKTMAELGVKKIPTVGERFDHSLHEAVEEVEGEEHEKVVKEIQPGFTLNGRLIAPAKVAVGKNRESVSKNQESGTNENNN
jgi:molecular chaperone GrpE